MTIHEYCACYRKSKGLTQEAMAERIGTDVSVIGRFERGKATSYPVLYGYLKDGMVIDREKIDWE